MLGRKLRGHPARRRPFARGKPGGVDIFAPKIKRIVLVIATHPHPAQVLDARHHAASQRSDRKSTRLNSSHVRISYAVFCLKKKTKCSSSTWTPFALTCSRHSSSTFLAIEPGSSYPSG